jgi:hypothetical protein
MEVIRPEAIVTEHCDGFVVTVNCACGWEALYLLPEECFNYLIGVLGHAKKHGAILPAIEHRTL